MNWQNAYYFLAVARAGKLNRAAEDLGISPITLSRHMARLQDEMHATLFTRNNQGVDLTQEGLRLLEHLERAEAEMDAASGFSLSEAEGVLRIAAPEGFALSILAPKIGAFIEENPRLNVEIVPLPRGFSITRREADIAIMVERPQEPKLLCEKLADYKLGLYATQNYLSKFGTPETAEDLRHHRLIGYVEDLLQSQSINTAKAAWPNWHSQIGIYSPIGQMEAVRASAGIGVLHQFLIPSDLSLIRVLPEIKLVRSFYIVTHQNLSKLPRIQKAIQFLHQIQVDHGAGAIR